MNVGKLYQVKKYFWLFYPSKEIAADTDHSFTTMEAIGEELVEYWSKKFNCNVSYFSPTSMFMLLEKDEKYCKVLTTNGKLGWIVYPENEDWCKDDIEEVNQ